MNSTDTGAWILTRGIIRGGGDILGVWTGPGALEKGTEHFNRNAVAVNIDPDAIETSDGGHDTEGTLYVSGRSEWLLLGYWPSGN